MFTHIHKKVITSTNKYNKWTYLSILIAHRLNIDAVQRSTSKEIQISHKIHPSCHDPMKIFIYYYYKFYIYS